MAGVKTIICPNPECKREHGLFWNVSSDRSKILSYRCEKHRIKKVIDHLEDGTEVFKLIPSRQAVIAPEGIIPDSDIPEQWTPSYRKKVLLKKNLQLIMTNK